MPLGDSISALLHTPEPADLGPHPRASTLSARDVNARLDTAFANASISAGSQQLIRSLLLLWHDHLDASHTISQDLHSSDGSFLHGIMHRREPDYFNAKYWFHRVGNHASYPEIAKRVSAFLDSKGAAALKTELIPAGKWDVDAFVDACKLASSRRGTEEQRTLLREIQRIETTVLIERFLAA
ncbi:MAG: hypothetical protein K0Q55_68 [Verrucomicrobia bacterium]|jgi:hypothetical protein|nr:hypothetical protein [Verrucomicrobiota bacterium]